jgi:hypothetical protein
VEKLLKAKIIYILVSLAIEYIIKAWAEKVDDESNSLNRAGLETLQENKDVIKNTIREIV